MIPPSAMRQILLLIENLTFRQSGRTVSLTMTFCHFGLKVTSYFKWNIKIIAKDGEWAENGRLKLSLQEISVMIYIHKTQIMREIEYSLNTFVDAAQSSTSNLDKVQNLLRRLMQDCLISLLQLHLPYAPSKLIVTLPIVRREMFKLNPHSLAPTNQTFTTNNRRVKSAERNLHFCYVSNLRRKFHLTCIFKEMLICVTDSRADTSLNTKILICFYQVPIVL